MSIKTQTRDHGGGLDAAVVRWGGPREDWLDLSTGINPRPYPVQNLQSTDWTALPDAAAFDRLTRAAREFWAVPDGLDILAAPGASALIAQMPSVAGLREVDIPSPTYNEHAAAFRAASVSINVDAAARVLVHPNNPDGRLWSAKDLPKDAFCLIDESFCDVVPDLSLLQEAVQGQRIILKSFGKFWGLAGLRLGFAIGRPEMVAPLRDRLGPWAVSGPALRIGAQALEDQDWANRTRARLAKDAKRLDSLLKYRCVGGCDLFRLYEVDDAEAFQERLGQAKILTRVFPYSRNWVRLGLPGSESDWARLEQALPE